MGTATVLVLSFLAGGLVGFGLGYEWCNRETHSLLGRSNELMARSAELRQEAVNGWNATLETVTESNALNREFAEKWQNTIDNYALLCDHWNTCYRAGEIPPSRFKALNDDLGRLMLEQHGSPEELQRVMAEIRVAKDEGAQA